MSYFTHVFVRYWHICQMNNTPPSPSPIVSHKQGCAIFMGKYHLRSSAVTINQNGGGRTRWVQTIADCVNTTPRLPSIFIMRLVESWDLLIVRLRKTATAGSGIKEFESRKFRRIDRNCRALLIVTAFWSQHLLIVIWMNRNCPNLMAFPSLKAMPYKLQYPKDICENPTESFIHVS